MSKFDYLIIGALGGFAAVVAVELLRFNRPVYVPALDIPYAIETDPRLNDLVRALEEGLKGRG